MFSKCITLALATTALMLAQQGIPTSAEHRLAGYAQRLELQKNSLCNNIPFTSIGPTVMSGRVVDIDVSPSDPTVFYVAYASGGLWKTTNNGISFTPVFENQATLVIGDVAVDWETGAVYIGTGENNSSRSSYSGTGVYRSTNGGASWQHLGLAASNRTGRIVLHPNNKQVVYVAAIGSLYTADEHRGVYRTLDGGASWEKVLFVNDSTGAIDLVMDPANPEVLYAAMWQRARTAWNFTESGNGSAIYKSTDGGTSWKNITGNGSGFPNGPSVGRIGLAVYPGNSSLLYALLDNQERRPAVVENEENPVTKQALLAMSADDFLSQVDADINTFLDDNGFPEEYTAASVKEQVRRGSILPKALVEYLGDANARLFDTPVTGAEVYRSSNGGASWQKMNKNYIDDFYYSYGYYFGGIRVHPADSEKVYIMGVPVLTSTDGGATFTKLNDDNAHADHHALWIDSTHSGHIILGNDGGVNISYDNGKTWFKANTPAVGQFYSVAYDYNKPFNVYGGLQDNGVWYGPVTYSHNYEWYQSGAYPYKNIMGGDGMQVAVDARDNNTVYTGFQFGNYYRLNLAAGSATPITPVHKLGETPYRFNWQTPVLLSPHNQDIVYFGSSRLFRSFDKGATWAAISPDLTGGARQGDVPYGTLTTIAESPLRFGVLYTGSDDGFIYASTDGGSSWNICSALLPRGYWVSRVEASRFDTAVVYASLNGYRTDNMDALVYRSSDYGKTWQQIGLNLPPEPINVVREDPVNKHIIYVGTDNGLYVSLNGGGQFMALGSGMPPVAVHDLIVHPRDKILVAATHGRSLFKADVSLLQQLTDTLLTEPLHMFPVLTVTHSKTWGKKGYAWGSVSAPAISIHYYSASAGIAHISITDGKGNRVAMLADTAEAGLNSVVWNGAVSGEALATWKKNLPEEQRNKPADNGVYYLVPGTYNAEISLNGKSAKIAVVCEQREKKSRK